MNVASACVSFVPGTCGSGATASGESVCSKFFLLLCPYHAADACKGSFPAPYTFFSVIFDTVPDNISSPVTKRTAVSACLIVRSSAAVPFPGLSVEAATKRSFCSVTFAGTAYERKGSVLPETSVSLVSPGLS